MPRPPVPKDLGSIPSSINRSLLIDGLMNLQPFDRPRSAAAAVDQCLSILRRVTATQPVATPSSSSRSIGTVRQEGCSHTNEEDETVPTPGYTHTMKRLSIASSVEKLPPECTRVAGPHPHLQIRSVARRKEGPWDDDTVYIDPCRSASANQPAKLSFFAFHAHLDWFNFLFTIVSAAYISKLFYSKPPVGYRGTGHRRRTLPT